MTRRWISQVSWGSVVSLGGATGVLIAALVLGSRLYLWPLGSIPLDSTVVVFAAHTDTGRSRELTSFASFEAWRARSESFSVLSGHQTAFVDIQGVPEAERLRGAYVALDFFEAINARFPVGRTFGRNDYAAGSGLVCVISDALWRRRFGADTTTLGRGVRLETSGTNPSGTFTVVGIAPPGFQYPGQTDIWLPFIPSEFFTHNHSGQWFAVAGRLKAGLAIDQADAELTTVMQRLQLEHPRAQPAHVANIVPLHDVATAERRTLVAALILASVLLFAVAATSAGALLAARSFRSRRDDAIRAGLGAPRHRLMTDAVTAGLVLGGGAFLIAIPMSMGLLGAFGVISVEMLDNTVDVRLSVRETILALVIVTATTTVTLVVLKLRSLHHIAKAGARAWNVGVVGNAGTMRVRTFLIVLEIAVTVVTMILAAGVVKRLNSIRDVEMGFVSDQLLTVRLNLPTTRYSEAQSIQFFDAALERLRSVSQVEGVAAASDEPLFGQSANPEFTLELEGRPLAPGERTPILMNGVTPDYFDLLDIHRIEGSADALDASGLTAVVNSEFGRRFYAGQSPVGRRFRFGGRSPPWWTIVGVVADTRNDGPLAPTKPTAYVSSRGFNKRGMTVFVKVSGDILSAVPAVRGVLASLDPDLPIGAVTAATQLVQRRFANVWIASRCLDAVSGAALLLSMIGLFGVLTALSAELRPEVALRIALGARPLDTMLFLWRRTGRFTLLGLAIGSIGGLAAAPLAAASLGFERPSPVHFIAIGALVLSVAVVSSIVPVMHAARVDPADSLRAQ